MAYGTMAGGLLSPRLLNMNKDDLAHNPLTQQHCWVIDLLGGWKAFQWKVIFTKKSCTTSEPMGV